MENTIGKRSRSLVKFHFEEKKIENDGKAQDNETATTGNTKSKKSNQTRYSSLLKALGDEVKKKKEDKENAKIQEEKKIEKLKINLGLNKIKPKINDKNNIFPQNQEIKLNKIVPNRPYSTNENLVQNSKPKLTKIIIDDRKKINYSSAEQREGVKINFI